MSKSNKQKKKEKKSSKPAALQSVGDPHVANCLRELEFHYQMDPAGDFRVIMKTDEERSQTCIIKSTVDEIFGIRTRKVYSPALRSFGPFDPRTADILLKENAMVKTGNWLVCADAEDIHLAIFQVAVPFDTSAGLLADVITCVSHVADHMEMRLSGRDEF